MGIDVSKAKRRAEDLLDEVSRLNSVKTDLSGTINSIASSWKAEEVQYLHKAVASIEAEINKAQNLLRTISSNIVSVAEEIRREEEAKAAAEKAARKAKEEKEKAEKAAKEAAKSTQC